VSNSSAVLIGTGATKMTWDTKDFDPYNSFDLANDRYQPKVAGYYRLRAQVRFAGSATGELAWLTLYKNGVVYKYLDAQKYLAANGAVTGSVIVYANGTTDYFEIYAQNSVARNTSADVTTSWFQGELIAASIGVAPEPWHVIGAGGEPAFATGWQASNFASVNKPRFFKDPHGVVHLDGLARYVGGGARLMFTLPVGYRPGGSMYFPGHYWSASTWSLADRVISSNGNVEFGTAADAIPPATDYAPLNGITFRAEQ
jgi:hypothetical protein